MIKRILKINDFGLFKSFNWSAEIPEFQKYNLIYGWNGSGKTTLSKIFQYLEDPDHYPLPEKSQFQLELANKSKLDKNSSSSMHSLRVFNRDFVEENISWEGSANKIVHVGKIEVQIAKRTTALKSEQRIVNRRIAELNAKTKKSERAFNQFVQQQASDIKKKLLKFDTSKSGYDRNNLIRLDQFLTEEKVKELDLKNKSEHDLRTSLSQAKKDKIDKLNLPNESKLHELIQKTNEMLKRNIISDVIEEAMKSSEINEWLRTGLLLHKNGNEENCLFCGAALESTRINALEAHFNEHYKSFEKDCDQLLLDIKSYKLDLEYLITYDFFYTDLAKTVLESLTTHKKDINAYNAVIEKMLTLVTNKKSQPFVKSEGPLEESLIKLLEKIKFFLELVGKVIDQHNQRTDNLAFHKSENLKLLEHLYFIEIRSEFTEKRSLFEANKKDLATLENERSELSKEIEKLEGQVDIGIAASKINSYLELFLGRSEISLTAAGERGYQILRNGGVAKNLSEGEKTALAFIYFIVKLEEKDFDKSTGIIFIDDPISSFDENSIYSASAFIQNQLDSCYQLFISTHNFQFFKLLRQWLWKRPDQDKAIKENRSPEKSLLMIRAIQQEGARYACLDKMDRLLAKNDSEYEYIFKILKNLSETSGLELKMYYSAANMCRKFLEIFLGFKYPRSEDLKSKLNEVAKNCNFDSQKKEDIFSFVNRYSHKDTSHFQNIDPTGLSSAPKVIKNIFELVKLSDPFHFEQLTKMTPNN